MANYVDLDTLVGFGAEADAALAKVVRAVMQANSWTVTGNANFRGGPTGYALHIPNARVGRIAKTGAGGIPAMTGSTPGVAEITLWTLGSTIVVGEPDIAYNIAPSAVSANMLIVVLWVDSEWLAIYEICPA